MDKGIESAQKKPFSKKSLEECFSDEPELFGLLANNCILIASGIFKCDKEGSAERVKEILGVENFYITIKMKEGNINEIFLTYDGLPSWQKVAELPSYVRAVIENDKIKYATIH